MVLPDVHCWELTTSQAGRFCCLVGFLEVFTEQVVQTRYVAWAEERPHAAIAFAFHEQVRHPGSRVDVVSSQVVFAGLQTQVAVVGEVVVPDFQIRGERALAFATLVHCDCGLVVNLQEREDAVAATVGGLDDRTVGTNFSPVGADTAGELAEQRGLSDTQVEDQFEVIRDIRQVAGRHLAVTGAGVEQRRRRRNVVHLAEHVVGVDCTLGWVVFQDRQAHCHAHPEVLRHFVDRFLATRSQRSGHQVAVSDGLNAQVGEQVVTLGADRCVDGFHVETTIEQTAVKLLEQDALAQHELHGWVGDVAAGDLLVDALKDEACGYFVELGLLQADQ